MERLIAFFFLLPFSYFSQAAAAAAEQGEARVLNLRSRKKKAKTHGVHKNQRTGNTFP